MKREEFVAKVREIRNKGTLMSFEDVRERIHRHASHVQWTVRKFFHFF